MTFKSCRFLAGMLSCCLALGSLAACGGGGGSSNPIPAITSLSPATVLKTDQGVALTVMGSGFVSGSAVEFNGNSLGTTFVSKTELKVQIPSSSIEDAGDYQVFVYSPRPGGGDSNMVTFHVIESPVPEIDSLSPASVSANGPAFTLSVRGSKFIAQSVVRLDDDDLPTTYVSENKLTAKVPAQDVSSPGTDTIEVVNPAPGGASEQAFLSVGYHVRVVSQEANDLVWNRAQSVIYLSVPTDASVNGNAVAVLDPSTGAIISSVYAGSQPDVLALSDNDEFLYVGLDGADSVKRFSLPGLELNTTIPLGSDPSLGPYFALDLQVAPAESHTVAISLGNFNVIPVSEDGIVIYDNATPRPDKVTRSNTLGGLFDTIQWGSGPTHLYAANNETTGFDFYTLSVDENGVTLDKDYGGDFTNFGFRIHYDSGTGLIYSDYGRVIDPQTGELVGNFNAGGRMVPDSALDKAFFIGQTLRQEGTPNFTIETFNLTQFTPLSYAVIPDVSGGPLNLIRWGKDGLAFSTTGGDVYLVSGAFVSEPAADQTRMLLPEILHRWQPPADSAQAWAKAEHHRLQGR